MNSFNAGRYIGNIGLRRIKGNTSKYFSTKISMGSNPTSVINSTLFSSLKTLSATPKINTFKINFNDNMKYNCFSTINVNSGNESNVGNTENSTEVESETSSLSSDETATSAEAKRKRSEEANANETNDDAENMNIHGELKKLRDSNKTATEKIAELQNKLLRNLAEQENSRSRHLKELENAKVYAISKFAKSIVEIADNLELATNHVDKKILEENEELKKIYDGIKMIQDILNGTFENYGINSYNPIGEIFDPNKHEAVFEMVDPSKTKGQITQVIQTGYTIKDRILRAAKVGVAKG